MKLNLGTLNLKIDLEFNSKTNQITVTSIDSNYVPTKPEPLKETRTLQKTEARYYILTLGANAFKGELPMGKNISVEYEYKTYEAKVHSSTKGRIDGLADFFKDSGLTRGDTIIATYIPDQRLLKIKKEKKEKS